jgi:class 3 adenylate cyclase
MQAEFARLLDARRARGEEPPVGIGVGVNRGEVIVGNIGSPRHLDYTVIGDSVNVASRLTSVARPGQVLVSAETLRDLEPPAGIELTPLGDVTVKGKDEPIPVYEARAARADTVPA